MTFGFPSPVCEICLSMALLAACIISDIVFFINRNYVTDSLQIANAFNKFVVSIGSLLAK